MHSEVYKFIFALAFMFVKVEGKAGIQYRISTESFNKVAKVLTSQPDGYFTYNNSTQTNGQIGEFKYKLSNFKMKNSTMKDVTVNIPRDNYVEANATFSRMELSGDVLIERPGSTQPLYSGTTNVVLSNVNVISEGLVEYVGVASSTIMVMNNRVEAEDVSPGSEFLQAVTTEVRESDVKKMFTDVVCLVYKLQFSLGFRRTTLDFELDIYTLVVTINPVHLAIVNKTLLLTYRVDMQSSDVSLPLNLKPYSIPQFPPIRDAARPFEIWLNVNVFNDYLADYVNTRIIRSQHKLFLKDILPMLPLGELTTDKLAIIPMIPYTFPNSTVDLYVTNGNASLVITPTQTLLNISAVVELEVTLNCNRTKTYTALKLLVNVFFPMQIGYNEEKITLRYVHFGGNVTVLETKVGRIGDRFLSHLFFSLPQLVPKGTFDQINKRIKGPKFEQLIPAGTFLHNASVTTVQDHILIQGDLSDEAPKIPDKNKGMNWIPEYTSAYFNNLWFPLIDNTPESQKPIPIQNCTVKTVISGASYYTLNVTCLASLIILAYMVVMY